MFIRLNNNVKFNFLQGSLLDRLSISLLYIKQGPKLNPRVVK